MAQWLDTSAADFEDAFRRFLGAKREVSADVDAAVADIIARVRSEGDAARGRVYRPSSIGSIWERSGCVITDRGNQRRR